LASSSDKSKVTLVDVARLAHVSPSTVSRVFSRRELVADDTVRRVMDAVRALNYRPNQLARNLRTSESRIVGLVITDIQNSFYGAIARGVQEAATENGYHLMLFSSGEDENEEREYLDILAEYQVQGIINVPAANARCPYPYPAVPVIEVDRTTHTPGVHAVLTNNVDGARAAVKHLIERGHTRIGVIAGRQDITTGAERLQGYERGLFEHGIPVDQQLVAHCEHTEEAGFASASKLLELPAGRRPTAIFAVNNETTLGTVLACRELGMRIPSDMSLVGFDDSRWALLMEPPLTVVRQQAFELGYTAAQVLFRMIQSKRRTVPSVTRLEAELVVRSSVVARRQVVS